MSKAVLVTALVFSQFTTRKGRMNMVDQSMIRKKLLELGKLQPELLEEAMRFIEYLIHCEKKKQDSSGIYDTDEKERLLLAQKKYDRLKTENRKLKDEVAKLQAENTNIKKQLEMLDNQKAGPLEEKEIEILKQLASVIGMGVTAAALSLRLNEPVPKLDYYLRHLNENEYVYSNLAVGQDPEYGLDQKGREYLIKNNLI